MDDRLETRLEELLSRSEIYDRLMKYIRGIDRNDGELVQDAFWTDALVDHGHSKFQGEGIGEIFEGVSKHATRGQSHWIMGFVIEIHGEQAITEAPSLYVAETERNGVAYIWQRSLRYIDRWERREGTWRIFHRTVVESWNKIDPIVERFPPNPNMIMASGERDDPSYRLFELVRNNEKPPLELPDNAPGTESAEHRTDPAGFSAATNEFWKVRDQA